MYSWSDSAPIRARMPFTNLPIEIELHGLPDFSRHDGPNCLNIGSPKPGQSEHRWATLDSRACGAANRQEFDPTRTVEPYELRTFNV